MSVSAPHPNAGAAARAAAAQKKAAASKKKDSAAEAASPEPMKDKWTHDLEEAQARLAELEAKEQNAKRLLSEMQGKKTSLRQMEKDKNVDLQAALEKIHEKFKGILDFGAPRSPATSKPGTAASPGQSIPEAASDGVLLGELSSGDKEQVKKLHAATKEKLFKLLSTQFRKDPPASVVNTSPDTVPPEPPTPAPKKPGDARSPGGRPKEQRNSDAHPTSSSVDGKLLPDDDPENACPYGIDPAIWARTLELRNERWSLEVRIRELNSRIVQLKNEVVSDQELTSKAAMRQTAADVKSTKAEIHRLQQLAATAQPDGDEEFTEYVSPPTGPVAHGSRGAKKPA
eukprot:NODE_558_length_1965_cov_13.157620_g17_i31.p1 GENE.NODE_558_length_1965_cov_13.157620_g17_i31~~NODE_558_length_1965_cov_13.157620_g17_i31.p1  ORF type:complete len:343 (-),score=101.33 NODE_558_length_1965_cov_13.157620_g17_i31:866-1894(-)